MSRDLATSDNMTWVNNIVITFPLRVISLMICNKGHTIRFAGGARNFFKPTQKISHYEDEKIPPSPPPVSRGEVFGENFSFKFSESPPSPPRGNLMVRL